VTCNKIKHRKYLLSILKIIFGHNFQYFQNTIYLKRGAESTHKKTKCEPCFLVYLVMISHLHSIKQMTVSAGLRQMEEEVVGYLKKGTIPAFV
jgi:hypothetical protein